MAQTQHRRTRIVCVSDTHNCTVKLPAGHVLIHAGDLTNQGSYSELSRAVEWLAKTDFEAKIVIAGNHDITLDPEFYARHGHNFHNQHPQSSSACTELLTSSPSLTYLNHESATIRLCSPDGPRTSLTVFGSPYSPSHGQWAFSYPPEVEDGSGGTTLSPIWTDIPDQTDIVVTHTPPGNHCDVTAEQRPRGCEALRQALWRVRPKLAVCGHIHDGRGAERVTWDARWTNDGAQKQLFTEASVAVWRDPAAGNDKKQSLLDLTGRKGPLLQPGETCVVNAAIMKSRYPHKDGKTFHKPIVVDVDLPVWTDE